MWYFLHMVLQKLCKNLIILFLYQTPDSFTAVHRPCGCFVKVRKPVILLSYGNEENNLNLISAPEHRFVQYSHEYLRFVLQNFIGMRHCDQITKIGITQTFPLHNFIQKALRQLFPTLYCFTEIP